MTERFVEKENNIYDTQYGDILCSVSEDNSCHCAVKRLNSLNNKVLSFADIAAEFQHKYSEVNKKYNRILELIDIKIQENEQLSHIHFPEPEDEYIDKYEARADELLQLKELILNGK